MKEEKEKLWSVDVNFNPVAYKNILFECREDEIEEYIRDWVLEEAIPDWTYEKGDPNNREMEAVWKDTGK